MTNLRQHIDEKYPVKCRDIRAREPKGKLVNWDRTIITVMEYDASGEKNFSFLLKMQKMISSLDFAGYAFPSSTLRTEITPESALVRELHVYGTATAIGDEGLVQHRGWGRKLMKKAEQIASEHGKNKIVVISGVGVRQYYQDKLGYRQEVATW